ncbi:AAA family ATPase [Streptomyces hirsutus]|uniref:AAA family ATPase n=1 Tax=Streptomyces hirsutus TaxID=35620 RepID=UPI00386B5D79|nr:AAA family ATPase [Streptomyces hirsutus]
MYLSRVYLHNIKSFGEVSLELIRPDGSYAGWTVLAGRNGSGKTTLLRAVSLAVSGPAAARSLMPGFENWVAHGERSASAEVELAHDPRYDRFAQGRRPSGPFWAGLEWKLPPESGGGRGKPGRVVQPSLEAVNYTGAKTITAQRGPWADNPEGWFCAAYGPFRRLVGGSGEVQRLMLASGPVARQTSLFHEDASLSEGVTWLIEQHLRALERREGADELLAAALEILGDDLLPDGCRIETVDSEGLWVTHQGRRFPLREMSDGYRTVAALVVDILKQIYDAYGELFVFRDEETEIPTADYAGVVIIDEIDAHLHVSWQRRIGSWLTSHFPSIQFIVTTHSPYICQSADPGGLIRLPGTEEEGQVEKVSPDVYDRVVYGSGDDAVLSYLFGLDTPYSEKAERKRSELVALEMSVLRGRASDEQRRRYRELKRKLVSSPAARVDEVAARLRDRADDEWPS